MERRTDVSVPAAAKRLSEGVRIDSAEYSEGLGADRGYVILRLANGATLYADNPTLYVTASDDPEDERCYHVNGGERTVDGWTCDDCGQFFPLGTVVEGQRG